MSRSLLRVPEMISLSVPFTKHSARLQRTLVMVLIFVFSSTLRAEWVGDAQPMMGTEVSVYVWHDDARVGEQLVAQVFAEASRIDKLMSTFNIR